VDLRFLRAKESIRLSFLIDPRPGGRAVLRREGGSIIRFSQECKKNYAFIFFVFKDLV
jgi:hypothetical protein